MHSGANPDMRPITFQECCEVRCCGSACPGVPGGGMCDRVLLDPGIVSQSQHHLALCKPASGRGRAAALIGVRANRVWHLLGRSWRILAGSGGATAGFCRRSIIRTPDVSKTLVHQGEPHSSCTATAITRTTAEGTVSRKYLDRRRRGRVGRACPHG